MGDYAVLTRYLTEAARSEAHARAAWGPRVWLATRGSVRVADGGSANLVVLRAAARSIHKNDFSIIERCLADALSGKDHHGHGWWEWGSGYGMAIAAAALCAWEVAARRRLRQAPLRLLHLRRWNHVDRYLRAETLMLSAFSVYVGRTGRWAARVCAPAWRQVTKNGNATGAAGMGYLNQQSGTLAERDWLAVMLRHEQPHRTPFIHREPWREPFPVAAARLSRWAPPEQEAAMARHFIAAPSPHRGRDVAERLNELGARLRPIRAPEGRAAMVIERYPSGTTTARITGASSHLGPVVPPFPAAMSISAAGKVELAGPWPEGWQFRPGGTAGILTAGPSGARVIGARRRRKSRPEDFYKSLGAAGRGWRLVVDPDGVRIEE